MTDRKPAKVGKKGKKKKRVAAKAGQNYDVKLEHDGRPLKLWGDSQARTPARCESPHTA